MKRRHFLSYRLSHSDLTNAHICSIRYAPTKSQCVCYDFTRATHTSSASSLIPLLTRDNSPDAPLSGFADITITPWDQVYMYVEDRLTC